VTRTSGRKPQRKGRTGQGNPPVRQSRSSTDAEIMHALERIADASNEELKESLETIEAEDVERISRLTVSYLCEAREFADRLAQQPDKSVAIRRAHERLLRLVGDLHPKKLVVLATWLCITSGMLTSMASPGSMPEINTQVAILGLGVAITFGLTSNQKGE
jgi:hypothetical protein